MHTYTHRVKYYETDKMGITHHSNYVRWMEEARMDYLKTMGYGMREIEKEGITSPVVSIECKYRHTTTFDDEIQIEVWPERYTGVKLVLRYKMMNAETGEEVFAASSTHCFVDGAGRPVAVKKRLPKLDEMLRAALLQKG